MPITPEFIALPKAKEMHAMMNWRDSPRQTSKDGAASTNATTPPPVAAALAADLAGNEKDGRGTGRIRGSRKRGGKEQHPQAPDVEDFFVHVALPPGVALQTLQFELQAQTTPLKIIDVGVAKVLFPRSAATATPTPHANAGGEEAPAATDPKNALLLAFKTPAMTAAVVSGADDEVFPPAIVLPLSAKAAAAAAPAVDGGAPPDHNEAGSDYRVSLLFAEKTEAEKVVAFLQKRWPAATVVLSPRSRAVLNASLVLKGLPSLNKTELIIEELERLPHKPSYVRLHRSDRGGFKNVVFVKYSNREDAEESKLRLERFTIGTRPLKVEFKKKSTKPEEARDGVANGGGNESLQQIVRDLRVSTEHEGFIYQRKDLSKEDIKMLKQLCQSYNLTFDMNETKVTVRRQLGVTNRGGWSASPSPAMRPQPTPMWAPSTPTPLRPMDFKGIRHWKDIRSQSNKLGIMRPVGPDDGVPPFQAGRGRPL